MEMRTASRNDFLDNMAKRGGGAVYIRDNAGVSLLNSLFVGNRAYSEDSPPIPAYGGALWVQDSTADIINNTFAENTAMTYGGAVYVARSPGAQEFQSYLCNNIFWRNVCFDNEGSAVYADNSPICLVSYSCVKDVGRSDPDDNSDNYYYSGDVIVEETSCLYLDPMFVDSENSDYHLRIGTTPSSTSPCIDKGLNPESWQGFGSLFIDHDGLPRPIDIIDSVAADKGNSAYTDLGAFECQEPSELPQQSE